MYINAHPGGEERWKPKPTPVFSTLNQGYHMGTKFCLPTRHMKSWKMWSTSSPFGISTTYWQLPRCQSWFEKEITEEQPTMRSFFPQWQRTMKTTIAPITRKYKVVQIRISYFPDPNIQHQKCQNLYDLHHFQVGLLGTIFVCLSNLILLWMSALSGEKKMKKFYWEQQVCYIRSLTGWNYTDDIFLHTWYFYHKICCGRSA